MCRFSFRYSGRIPLLTKIFMTILIVSSLSVTSNALFDYSYLVLGHTIGFRVVRYGYLLFYSQRERILSKFLSVDTASLVTQNLFGYIVSSINPPLLEGFTKLLASWSAKGYNSTYLVKRSTIGRKYRYPPLAQRSVPMSILRAGFRLLGSLPVLVGLAYWPSNICDRISWCPLSF